jgi:hypothetical protein
MRQRVTGGQNFADLVNYVLYWREFLILGIPLTH